MCPFDIKRRSHHPIQLVYSASKASDPLFQSIKSWLHKEAKLACRRTTVHIIGGAFTSQFAEHSTRH